MDYAFFVQAFGAFFAIMNPFVNLPIFLSLTSDFTVDEQRRVAVKVTLFSAIMCAVILVGGKPIIAFFGITVDEFRIAGGVVLSHIALSMLNGSSIASHHGTEKEQDHMAEVNNIAFFPITFPIIVGPGTIATIIIYASHGGGMTNLLTVGIVLGVILIMLFFVFCFASFFGKILSETMRVIMTRLMGMILLAIAVEMITAGIKVVFPGLVG